MKNKTLKKYDVTAFGESLIDFTEAGLSPAGMRLFEQNPGGAVTNALTALSRYGAKTAFIGKVGQDMHGRFLKETLVDVGIDVRGLVFAEDVFTTLAFVTLDAQSGERDFSFARKPGADICLREDELDIELLEDTKILHIGSLSLTDEPCRSATYEAVSVAKKAGAIISYDPNYRAPLWSSIDEAIKRMREPLPFVDIMKLSDEETELLTDISNPEKAAAELNSRGIKLVAVTLGKDGAIVCKDGQCKKVPGFEVNAVDTTGAGDAFWGGFIFELLRSGKSLEQVSLDDMVIFARLGNATAACCVGHRGAIPAMPTMEEAKKSYFK